MSGATTTRQTDNRHGPVSLPWRAWLFVFTFFLIVYSMTASRGVQWQDSGFQMLRVVTGELINVRGLALAHPLHHWFCRAAVWIGLFSPAYAITLVSSIAGALAVANTFGCVWSLTGRGRAAIYAACSLGIANTFWQMATITETYTLVAALLSAEIWALVLFLKQPSRSRLWLILAIGGLGVANHNLGGLTLPIVAVVGILAVRHKQVTARDFGIGVVFWLLGSLSYSALVVSEVGRSGDFIGTLSSALFGNIYRDDVLNLSLSSSRILINSAFVLLNFPGLLLPLAIVGIVRIRHGDYRDKVRWVMLAGLAIHLFFAIRFSVVDQHTFFIPTYVFLAVFGGIGFDRLLSLGSARGRWVGWSALVFLLLTPLFYAAVPGVARRMNVLKDHARNKPYRDDYTYIFTPWSVSERSAEQISGRAIALAGELGLIVVADSMAKPAVLFKLHESPDRDVVVVRDLDPDLLTKSLDESRTVVFVPSSMENPLPPLEKGHWRRDGDLYIYTDDSQGNE